MKTLVVGGTGLIGSHTAVLLAERGHAVTVAGRNAPAAESLVADYPVLLGDYSQAGFNQTELEDFEAVVFCAGQDVRHVGSEGADPTFWSRYQSDGVPTFVERARNAGVRRVVQVGSYYHVVRPDLAATNPYVRARQLADESSRALADADFNVSTLNPPSIVGMAPGLSTRRFAKLLAWARGELAGKVGDYAPAGGTNYMSVRSLAEAVVGALANAEPGAAYLIGDENITYRDYFQIIFDLSGSGRTLDEVDESHPFMPDSMIVPGRGAVISYEPSADVVELLGYRRHDVRPILAEMVDTVNASNHPSTGSAFRGG